MKVTTSLRRTVDGDMNEAIDALYRSAAEFTSLGYRAGSLDRLLKEKTKEILRNCDGKLRRHAGTDVPPLDLQELTTQLANNLTLRREYIVAAQRPLVSVLDLVEDVRPASVTTVPQPPTVGFAKLTKNPEPSACTVCFNDMPKDEQVLQLPCKHTFHADCVSQWIVLHSTCPNCRAPAQLPN